MGKTKRQYEYKLRKKGLSSARPKVKKCLYCLKRRVTHHHYYCNVCWANKNTNIGG